MTEHNHASIILSLANRFLDFLDRRSKSKSWPFVVLFVVAVDSFDKESLL